MKIDFDISTLNPDKVTGVGVYMLQLLEQAKLDTEVDFNPVLKASRYKNKKLLADKIPQKSCQLYFPWSYLLKPQSLIHGPDFKVPRSAGKRIVTIHDMVVFEKKYNEVSFYEKGIRQLTRTLESAPDAIVVNSDFTRSEILKYFPNLKTPIFRTHLGCDRLTVNPAKTLRLPEKFILFVGTLEKRKNITGILQAFAKYRQQGGSSHLVLAGGWGFGQSEIQESLSLSPVKEVIHHLSYVPHAHLGELYSRAEVFFFPSLYEGFGLPILEAMSLGIPVVTSHFGSMREVAGEAALLTDPESPQAMAQSLLALESFPEKKIQLAKLGPLRAQEFSWNRCWQETKKVYKILGFV